jgi:hypothetical protein
VPSLERKSPAECSVARIITKAISKKGIQRSQQYPFLTVDDYSFSREKFVNIRFI